MTECAASEASQVKSRAELKGRCSTHTCTCTCIHCHNKIY